MSNWQKIETAPREGLFLGYFENGEQHVVGIDEEGKCYRELDDNAWDIPTRWQALPQPPEEE